MKALSGFAAGGLQTRLERRLVAGHAHAASAAAGRRLYEYREADGSGEPQRFLLTRNQPFAAGHDGDAGLDGEFAGLILVAEQVHGLVRRADELDLAIAALLRETGILGQEAVAGMNGLDVRHLGGADDLRDVEVALVGRRRADANGLVGQ